MGHLVCKKWFAGEEQVLPLQEQVPARREACWLTPCRPESQEFQGQVWPCSGDRPKGTHLLNKSVHLSSFWFCRRELWQDPRSSAGKKTRLFSVEPAAFAHQASAEQTCWGHRLVQLPLSLPGRWPQAPGSARRLRSATSPANLFPEVFLALTTRKARGGPFLPVSPASC